MSMEYRPPGAGGKPELITAIERNVYESLCDAMVDAVFNVDDWQWLQTRYLGLIHHTDWRIRALAATCLGHVATFFDRLDVDVVVPELERLKGDPRTRSYAETALDDVGTERPMRQGLEPNYGEDPGDSDPDES